MKQLILLLFILLICMCSCGSYEVITEEPIVRELVVVRYYPTYHHYYHPYYYPHHKIYPVQPRRPKRH